MTSGPITSWEIDLETVDTVSEFIFGGSKITADGDCSHEIKRCLLLWRKVMTNCREPAREIPPMTKVMRKRPDRQRQVRSQGVLCLSIYPETKICLFTVCYTVLFWHYRGYPQPPFSGKSWFRAPVNSLLHIKRMSQFKSLWWLSNLPDRSARTFTTC